MLATDLYLSYGWKGERDKEGRVGGYFTCPGPILWLVIRADTFSLFAQCCDSEKKKAQSSFINKVTTCAFQRVFEMFERRGATIGLQVGCD